MARTLRWYEVLSPEYGSTIPVLDDGSGPTEYGRDYLLTQAYNAREAVTRAVCYWRRQPWRSGGQNGDYCRDASGNPFAKIKATRADDETVADSDLDSPAFALRHPDDSTPSAGCVAAEAAKGGE